MVFLCWGMHDTLLWFGRLHQVQRSPSLFPCCPRDQTRQPHHRDDSFHHENMLLVSYILFRCWILPYDFCFGNFLVDISERDMLLPVAILRPTDRTTLMQKRVFGKKHPHNAFLSSGLGWQKPQCWVWFVCLLVVWETLLLETLAW